MVLKPSYFPDLCFVLSTRRYCCPFPGVGGSGSPFTTVTSVLVVVFWYCPDVGACCPGDNGLLAIAKLLRLEINEFTSLYERFVPAMLNSEMLCKFK